MSAFGPKRTSLVAPHMSAFGGKADMTIWACLLLRSLLGVKRTLPLAAHMSASDPKRTWPNSIFKKFIARGMPVDCRSITLIDGSSSTLNYWLRRTNKKKRRPKPMGTARLAEDKMQTHARAAHSKL